MRWRVSTRTCPALDLVSDAAACQLEGKKMGRKAPHANSRHLGPERCPTALLRMVVADRSRQLTPGKMPMIDDTGSAFSLPVGADTLR